MSVTRLPAAAPFSAFAAGVLALANGYALYTFGDAAMRVKDTDLAGPPLWPAAIAGLGMIAAVILCFRLIMAPDRASAIAVAVWTFAQAGYDHWAGREWIVALDGIAALLALWGVRTLLRAPPSAPA